MNVHNRQAMIAARLPVSLAIALLAVSGALAPAAATSRPIDTPEPPEVISVAVTAVETTLFPGQAVQLAVSALLADGSQLDLTGDPFLTYQEAPPGVVTVDSTGVLSAVAGGRARIFVRYHGNVVPDHPRADLAVVVQLPADRDADGMPDDFEVEHNLLYQGARAAGLRGRADTSAPCATVACHLMNSREVRILSRDEARNDRRVRAKTRSRVHTDKAFVQEVGDQGWRSAAETSRRDLLRHGVLALGFAGAMPMGGCVSPALRESPRAGESGKQPPNERPLNERAERAYEVRLRAAEAQRALAGPSNVSNGDERSLPRRIACFSKCLPHNELGEVDGAAYGFLLAAVRSGEHDAFEKIPLGGYRIQLETIRR